jgi:hypothetical protein
VSASAEEAVTDSLELFIEFLQIGLGD